jgi:hypothetical protein
MDKAALIEKYRHINVEYDDWYDYIYDDFIADCEAQGIEVDTITNTYGKHSRTRPDITWSGFWSQGDGAAFGGRVDDINKLLGATISEYPMVDKYIDELKGYYRQSWGTSHNNWVQYNDYEIEDIVHYLEDDHPFTEIWQEQLEKEMEQVDEDVRLRVNSLCGDLYRRLEREYEDLTSDEVVWDTIVANELNNEEI